MSARTLNLDNPSTATSTFTVGSATSEFNGLLLNNTFDCEALELDLLGDLFVIWNLFGGKWNETQVRWNVDYSMTLEFSDAGEDESTLV